MQYVEILVLDRKGVRTKAGIKEKGSTTIVQEPYAQRLKLRRRAKILRFIEGDPYAPERQLSKGVTKAIPKGQGVETKHMTRRERRQQEREAANG